LPPTATRWVGFSIVILGILIAGSATGLMLARLLQAVGLGTVDRLLGAGFGLARGVLLVLAGTLVAGITAIPRQDWWQNSILAPHFAEAALSLRPYLPRDWADRLDYSAAGSPPAVPGPAAGPGGKRI
jgi:membrane protein required for colicin V production